MIEAARIYASPPFSGSCFVWGMGLTQHTNGTANCHAVLNLALGLGADGQARERHLAAAGPEQRPGLRRRRLHPQTTCPATRTLSAESLEKFARAWGGRIPEEKGMVVNGHDERGRGGSA